MMNKSLLEVQVLGFFSEQRIYFGRGSPRLLHFGASSKNVLKENPTLTPKRRAATGQQHELLTQTVGGFHTGPKPSIYHFGRDSRKEATGPQDLLANQCQRHSLGLQSKVGLGWMGPVRIQDVARP